MGLFDFLKPKEKSKINNKQVETANTRKVKYEFPIANNQKGMVLEELTKMNDLLKSLDCTKKLFLDPSIITFGSCSLAFEPFTVKTMKISKCPCYLKISATVYGGYTVIIYYDIDDNIVKGKISAFSKKLTYTIDFKNNSGKLQIMKVLTTNDNGDNKKLYHLTKDGEIVTIK